MSEQTLDILRVTNALYPRNKGGIGLHTHWLSEYQAERGHNVDVVVPTGDEHEFQHQETAYEVQPIPETISLLDNRISVRLASHILRKASEYDIVHAHSHLFFHTNVSAIANVLHDTPLLITNHGFYSQAAPEWTQRIFLPTMGRLTYELADGVFCYTEDAEEILKEHGIDTEVTVIPNGIDCETFHPEEDSQDQTKTLQFDEDDYDQVETPQGQQNSPSRTDTVQLQQEDPGQTVGQYESDGGVVTAPMSGEERTQLLFVGRFVEGKGVEKLPDILDIVCEERPETELLLVGDGPLRTKVEAQFERRELEDQVSFYGEIPNEQLPELYRQSEAVVLTSETEAAAPRVAMEAWACEKPVVTFRFDELQPDVEACTVIVDNYDNEAMARAIIDLVDNDKRRQKLGENGRELVESAYSWESTARQVTQTYYEYV
jgi:glycosyltransferase involved in cell wall biosynthesis